MTSKCSKGTWPLLETLQHNSKFLPQLVVVTENFHEKWPFWKIFVKEAGPKSLHCLVGGSRTLSNTYRRWMTSSNENLLSLP